MANFELKLEILSAHLALRTVITGGNEMKNMAKHNLTKSTAAIFAILSIFSIAEVALAKSTRKFLDSSHPLAKAVVVVDQVGQSGLPGNGVIVGAGGCHVLTNYHIAFGKTKDTQTGNVTMVENVGLHHKVAVSVDFDSKAGRFKRSLRAKVIDYGNFESETRRGKTEDYALLELEECLGPGYGVTAFEQNADGKRVPSGKLSTVALTMLDGKMGIVVEEECPVFEGIEGRPGAIAPLTGSVGTNCFLQGGMSGSMLLATDESGVARLVGINQGKDQMANGSVVSFAVYARKFNKVLASVLGEGPFASSDIAGDRRPQTEQTAMAPAGRTVVR